MKPIIKEDFLDYRYLSEVTIAPTNEWAAFIVKKADLEANTYRADLYAVRLSDGEVRPLTDSGRCGSFVWTADGCALLHLVQEEGAGAQIALYRTALDGGTSERVATLPHRAGPLERVGEHGLLYTAWESISQRPEDDSPDFDVFDELPFWSNDAKSVINKQRKHLFYFDWQTGEEKLLVGGSLHVTSFGHDGTRVAVAAIPFVDKAPLQHNLYILDMESGKRQCISEGEYALGAGAGGDPKPLFLSDDRVAIPGTDMKRYGLRQSWEVLTFDLNTHKVQSLTPDWIDTQPGTPGMQRVLTDCRHGGGAVDRADGGRVFFGVSEGDSCYLYAVDQAGRLERVVGETGTVDAFDVREGRIVYVGMRWNQLQEIYVSENGQERQLTHLNAEALADRAISVPEPFTFVTRDGVEIASWIMKPFGFDPNKRYPGVLFVRGGPKAASGPVFFHELQAWAGHGYVVFYCNPRGSAGRGEEFGDIRGKYGTVDYEDVMALTDYVVETYGYVDGDRLGVMGGSYGGFMANWIIGHTDRFRVACSQRSISNWTSFLCGTDIGYYFAEDQNASTPWDDDGGEKLWWHSPLRYADQATTPTLFINSDRDYMCWPPEGIQMFGALQYHGVPSRLVMFHGENHDLSRTGKPRNRLRRIQEMFDWFDPYLMEG